MQPVPQQTATSLASQRRIPCAAHSAAASDSVAVAGELMDTAERALLQTEPPHEPSLAQQRTAWVSVARAHEAPKELVPQPSKA